MRARKGINSLYDDASPCTAVHTDHIVHDNANMTLRLLLSLTFPANNDTIENTIVNPNDAKVAYCSLSKLRATFICLKESPFSVKLHKQYNACLKQILLIFIKVKYKLY